MRLVKATGETRVEVEFEAKETQNREIEEAMGMITEEINQFRFEHTKQFLMLPDPGADLY